jgi:UDP-3-O-acyl-N-acetylglucosamine deacetylase
VTIGKNIQSKLNLELDAEFENIEVVVIENQISPIANRMKTIQGMIAQYFIMKIPNIRIEFVNASNKLKDGVSVKEVKEISDEKTDKIKYGERKKQGIKKSIELLEQDGKYQEWVDFFQKHGKKDDLADCFLQGIWFIKNKW